MKSSNLIFNRIYNQSIEQLKGKFDAELKEQKKRLAMNYPVNKLKLEEYFSTIDNIVKVQKIEKNSKSYHELLELKFQFLEDYLSAYKNYPERMDLNEAVELNKMNDRLKEELIESLSLKESITEFFNPEREINNDDIGRHFESFLQGRLNFNSDRTVGKVVKEICQDQNVIEALELAGRSRAQKNSNKTRPVQMVNKLVEAIKRVIPACFEKIFGYDLQSEHKKDQILLNKIVDETKNTFNKPKPQ